MPSRTSRNRLAAEELGDYARLMTILEATPCKDHSCITYSQSCDALAIDAASMLFDESGPLS